MSVSSTGVNDSIFKNYLPKTPRQRHSSSTYSHSLQPLRIAPKAGILYLASVMKLNYVAPQSGCFPISQTRIWPSMDACKFSDDLNALIRNQIRCNPVTGDCFILSSTDK